MSDLLNKIELMLEELQVYQEPVKSQLTQTVAGVMKDLFSDPRYSNYKNPIPEADFDRMLKKDWYRIQKNIASRSPKGAPGDFTYQNFWAAGNPPVHSNVVFCLMHLKNDIELNNADSIAIMNAIYKAMMEVSAYMGPGQKFTLGEAVDMFKEKLSAITKINKEQIYRIVIDWASDDAQMINFLKEWVASKQKKAPVTTSATAPA
jgi:hypothetical protein